MGTVCYTDMSKLKSDRVEGTTIYSGQSQLTKGKNLDTLKFSRA